MDTYNDLLHYYSGIDLDEVIELDAACMSIFERLTSDPENLKPTMLVKVQSVLDYTYEKINIGDWKEVNKYLRKTMTIASYLKLLIAVGELEKVTKDKLKELYQIIDHGLLFGSPLLKEPMLLQKSAAILNKIAENAETETSVSELKMRELNYKIYTRFEEVERVNCPSLETFYKKYLKTETPVILTGCIDHWPALTKWKDSNYLLKLAGMRTFPIEVGRKYTDHEWTQKLMTLEDFIKNHILTENKANIGYLAQYQLFHHIPELLNDISKPDYCGFAENDEVDINAWFGPRMTVSPLHQDSKHNLFAQVIGTKNIYLYAPTETEFLYPHREDLLHNTAIIDPRRSNLELYPKYAYAQGKHCVLQPGEMLYIPKDWWHFVEALTTSFSVSFWWENTV